MRLRQLATAFLFNDNKILMMKRQNSTLFAAEFWSGVGGHLEPHELNNPTAACLREIAEETGLQQTDLSDLSLRYILMRLKENELRQQYVYFGKSRTTDVTDSEEGQLFWLERNELDSLKISSVIRLMLHHYWMNQKNETIHIGVMGVADEGTPTIQWSPLTDPVVF